MHILPEKIAEKRHHPQKQAITTVCLLSLFLWRRALADRLDVACTRRAQAEPKKP